MISETAQHSAYELAVTVFAPRYYYSRTKGDDEYSKQIVNGKHQDLSQYFFEHIKPVFIKLPTKSNVIVFVPSHKDTVSPTLQSVAYQLQQEFKIPYKNIIRRKGNKKQTSCSSRDERYREVKGAFKIDKRKHHMEGLNVVLLDDVKTTGLTILECAKELKRVGAENVVGLCLSINR